MMNKQRNKTKLPHEAVTQQPIAAPVLPPPQPKASKRSGQRPIQDIPLSDPTKAVESNHDEVARRAREIYIEKGCPQGQDDQIWLQAEIELRHKRMAALRSKLHL